MHGFFSKVLALGVVAAGFFLTGDLGWVLDRAGSWARGDAAAASTTGVADEPATTADAAVGVPPPPPPPAPVAATPASNAADSPSRGLPEGGVTLPPLTDQQVVLSVLRSGDRILARTQHEVVAFDLIDPASGEAVEHRHALLSSTIATAAALATPRRVLLPATLAVGQPAVFPAVGTGSDALPPPAGAITALGVERPLD